LGIADCAFALQAKQLRIPSIVSIDLFTFPPSIDSMLGLPLLIPFQNCFLKLLNLRQVRVHELHVLR
jgi:hypothetical protein